MFSKFLHLSFLRHEVKSKEQVQLVLARIQTALWWVYPIPAPLQLIMSKLLIKDKAFSCLSSRLTIMRDTWSSTSPHTGYLMLQTTRLLTFMEPSCLLWIILQQFQLNAICPLSWYVCFDSLQSFNWRKTYFSLFCMIIIRNFLDYCRRLVLWMINE